MERSVVELLTDARLSTDARVLGAYIASLGPGAHEVSRATLADVLGPRTGKGRVQRAIAELLYYHWVHRFPGGRDHFDRFEFRGRESEPLNDIGAAKPGSYTDRGRETRLLNDNRQDRGREIEPLNESGENRGRESEPLNESAQDRSPEIRPLNPEWGDYRGDSGMSPSSFRREASTAAATSPTAGASEREAAVAEMKRDAIEAAKRIERGPRRSAFNAQVRGLVEGDDFTAWADRNGDQVPWSERPRLLRLAMDRVVAGEARDVRFALRYFVVPQQYDPIPQRRAGDAPRGEAASCTVEDLKTLLATGGSDLHYPTTRLRAFTRCQERHPEVWARAGPIFARIDDFPGCLDLHAKGDRFGLDRKLNEYLRRTTGRHAA